MSESQDTPDVPDVTWPRRRWLLPAAGLAAALAAALGAGPDRPAVVPAAAPTSPAATIGGGAPAPVGSATPGATAIPAGPTSSAVPVRATTPQRRPAPARSTTAPARRPPATTGTTRPSCTPAGAVDVVQVFTDGVVKVAARTDGEWSDQLCPGERIRVFWATYTFTADGAAKLYGSQVRYLDRAAPTWTMRLSLPDSCGPWYVVSGSWGIPQTLKPGAVPFGGGKLHWDTGNHC
ncbi:hypothetical protein ACIBPB_17575 [Micromonospora sp. NPDC049836]|uniref:hypothetical protein n=1 Tax=Micromonospora sp. NPDC049836 TaxID=3364274 RepID=UPI0037A63278